MLPRSFAQPKIIFKCHGSGKSIDKWAHMITAAGKDGSHCTGLGMCAQFSVLLV